MTRAEAQANVLQTLGTLHGSTPGFTLPQNPRGFAPTFINSHTGAVWGNETGTQQFSIMSTGLMHAGLMFAKTYFEHTDPRSANTVKISELASALFDAVKWDAFLCGPNGRLDPNGTGLPMLVNWADGCEAVMPYVLKAYLIFFAGAYTHTYYTHTHTHTHICTHAHTHTRIHTHIHHHTTTPHT